MSRCSWRFLFVRFPYQTAGGVVDVRQAAGDGFAVDADLGGGVHLREPAHDIKLHDLLIDLIQYALVSDALPVAAREVFQLLRQSQPRSYAFVTPFGPPPGRPYFSLCFNTAILPLLLTSRSSAAAISRTLT